MVKNQSGIGVFIIFTCQRLLWVTKDKGEFWTDEYFSHRILAQHVFPFLKNEENFIDPDEVLFVHDKATCNGCFRINGPLSIFTISCEHFDQY